MVFDGLGPLRELKRLPVVQHETVALRIGRLDDLGRAEAPLAGVHHFLVLAAETFGNDGITRGTEHFFGDEEFIGHDAPLHHRLAQTPRAVNHDNILKAGLGVDGEHHAGGTRVCRDHALHRDRKRDGKMVEMFVEPVVDGACGEERCEARFDGAQDILVAPYAEVGVVLSGEARVGQVFGGCTRADGDIDVPAVFLFHRAVSADYLRFQLRGHRRALDACAHFRAHTLEAPEVAVFEPAERRADKILEPRLADEEAVACGGDDEARRDADALRGEFLQHLAE